MVYMKDVAFVRASEALAGYQASVRVQSVSLRGTRPTDGGASKAPTAGPLIID
jgi:hypothetical protein